jgi:hypothetical protein
MKNQYTIDMDKLNNLLDSPDLEKDFQEVFSFVETVTGQQYEPDKLTSHDIELWNNKFDEVLKYLYAHQE